MVDLHSLATDHLALFEMKDQPTHHEMLPLTPGKQAQEFRERNARQTHQSDHRDLDPAALPKSTSRCLLILGQQHVH